MMDTALAEIRALELRKMELEAEKARLRQRRLEILDLDRGSRKAKRDTLSRENTRASFDALKRGRHEHGTA